VKPRVSANKITVGERSGFSASDLPATKFFPSVPCRMSGAAFDSSWRTPLSRRILHGPGRAARATPGTDGKAIPSEISAPKERWFKPLPRTIIFDRGSDEPEFLVQG
jgi:hypothetical protein